MKEVIQQPEWLNFRRCIWINICDKCKKFIVENEIIEDQIHFFICSKCKYQIVKHGYKYVCSRSSLKVKCHCGRYFLPKRYDRSQKECDKCGRMEKEADKTANKKKKP